MKDNIFDLNGNIYVLQFFQPQSLYIFGKKYKVQNWKDVVEKVLKYLYFLDESLFKEFVENKKNKPISKDKGNLRMPVSIDEMGYYFEGDYADFKLIFLLKDILSLYSGVLNKEFKSEIKVM